MLGSVTDNRIFFICGCDTFTRAYYAKNFGIKEIPEFDVQPEELPTTAVRAPVPAYNGIGTQEDSFGSVLYLVPKPAQLATVPSLWIFSPH